MTNNVAKDRSAGIATYVTIRVATFGWGMKRRELPGCTPMQHPYDLTQRRGQRKVAITREANAIKPASMAATCICLAVWPTCMLVPGLENVAVHAKNCGPCISASLQLLTRF
ncbi:MAG: hypothetical protein ACLPXB_06145 [Thiobacillaceae bacterium]